MKIIVVGCTHAGTAAVVNLAKLYPDAQITIYEQNDNISFLSCGIALYVEGVIKDVQGLFYSSPNQLKELGAQTCMRHEALKVDLQSKKIQVKNLESGEVFEDTFDKLVVTTGSWPICPKFEGGDLENILLCKNFSHAQTIIEKTPAAKNVTVIGAGYIGVELAEALQVQGKNVTLIDSSTHIMGQYFDPELLTKAEEELQDHGVHLALGEKVQKFIGSNGKISKVITDQNEYEADLAILCIGFAPNTKLFKGQLDMLDNGAIRVDEYMRSSHPDVVAAGDCCTVHYNPTDETCYIPLATNAIRSGTLAARNLMRPEIKQSGTQGTSGIKIYNSQMAATGLTEAKALKHFPNVKSVTVHESFRPEFMPTHEKVLFKVIYNGDNGKILGAQLYSKADYTQVINTMSICIYNQMTVEQLAFVDQFFQPHFNKPWNLINTAGLSAL